MPDFDSFYHVLLDDTGRVIEILSPGAQAGIEILMKRYNYQLKHFQVANLEELRILFVASRFH